jgi:hypothetical protein
MRDDMRGRRAAEIKEIHDYAFNKLSKTEGMQERGLDI